MNVQANVNLMYVTLLSCLMEGFGVKAIGNKNIGVLSNIHVVKEWFQIFTWPAFAF